MPFFVSGRCKLMGKLTDRIFFGVQGPGGWVWGAVLCVWPLHVYGITSR